MGQRIRRSSAALRGRRGAGQAEPQSARDGAHHRILHREDVAGGPVVRSGPELPVAGCIDEPRDDPDPFPRALDASLEHGLYPELLPDRVQVVASSLERERRCARRDPEPGQLAQRADQLIGDAIAEVVVGGIAADARERQHGQRTRARSGRRGRAVIPLRPDQRGREEKPAHQRRGELAARPSPRRSRPDVAEGLVDLGRALGPVLGLLGEQARDEGIERREDNPSPARRGAVGWCRDGRRSARSARWLRRDDARSWSRMRGGRARRDRRGDRYPPVPIACSGAM